MHCQLQLRIAVLALWLVTSVMGTEIANELVLDERGAPKTIAFTQEKCFTKYATKKPRSVPTSTQAKTLTLQLPFVIKSTATSTVTPAPTTTTVTATATATTTSTDTTVTDIFTATLTPSTTVTATSTSTETDTATLTETTTTTTTSTTVVATQPGFTPLASQIAAAGQTPARRDIARGRGGSLMARAKAVQGRGLCSSRYPSSVTCKKLVEKVSYVTLTVSAHRTNTITAAQKTSTATTTQTVTSTATVAPPDVSTTITQTAATSTETDTTTTTTTTTVTTTTTQTATASAPGPTTYDACQADNLVQEINGQYIYHGTAGGDYNVQDAPATSATDCCNLCQQDSTCSVFVYEGTAGDCEFADGVACPDTFTLDTSTDDYGFVWGTSACGQYQVSGN